MKPLIGITSSMELNESYYMIANDNVKAIAQSGGLPVMLPYVTDDEAIDQIAKQIDGLYATGGYDIDPTFFGEEPHPKLGEVVPARDIFEIALIQKMLELGKPILGVCRGAQVLNVATGGNMYQDIYAQHDEDVDLLQHNQKAPKQHGSHFVNVTKGSLLHRLTGMEALRVNSRHHQANRQVVAPLQISGRANDGVVEAIESKEHVFVLGVQWHPESMRIANDLPSIQIFNGFIAACKGEQIV